MKSIRLLLIAVAGTALMASMAYANPGMLPAHPGYPSADTKSPVDGTRTSHDAGQGNAACRSLGIQCGSKLSALLKVGIRKLQSRYETKALDRASQKTQLQFD